MGAGCWSAWRTSTAWRLLSAACRASQAPRELPTRRNPARGVSTSMTWTTSSILHSGTRCTVAGESAKQKWGQLQMPVQILVVSRCLSGLWATMHACNYPHILPQGRTPLIPVFESEVNKDASRAPLASVLQRCVVDAHLFGRSLQEITLLAEDEGNKRTA